MRILPTLALLALMDSSSFGTFDIPILMLVQRRVRAAAVLAYLGALAAFYWCLGMALVFGARGLVDAGQHLARLRAFAVGELVLGAALILGSLFMSQKRATAKKEARLASGAPPTLMQRWQARLVGERASIGAVAGIAVGVGALEAASMLPFLGAMTMVLNAHWPLGLAAAVLAGYVLLMVTPPIVMLLLRVFLGPRIENRLARVYSWMESHSTVIFAWVLRAVGVFLLWDAGHRLHWWR
ncbi:GAP family protein [Arthrobacter sp. UM1]|uniref:GAP family protein n=1 Tax=Arthrobacter sp. UM1 TaxID=2766776 RepID=UPI001CF6E27C|nr:GAP family protein [Arthrobacter sp. UM1]MCB4209040.1 GAP family protein [Arthrobacter sp. UM1]